MIRTSSAVVAMVLVLLASGAGRAAEGEGGDPERGAFRPEVATPSVATEVFSQQQGAENPFSPDVDINPRRGDPFVPQGTAPSERAGHLGDETEADANGSATRYRED